MSFPFRDVTYRIIGEVLFSLMAQQGIQESHYNIQISANSTLYCLQNTNVMNARHENTWQKPGSLLLKVLRVERANINMKVKAKYDVYIHPP